MGCIACVGGGLHDEGFPKSVSGMMAENCWSVVAADGLLRRSDLVNGAGPFAFWVCSELAAAGLGTDGPLQCMLLCLLSMAERVKLFPQVLQT